MEDQMISNFQVWWLFITFWITVSIFKQHLLGSIIAIAFAAVSECVWLVPALENGLDRFLASSSRAPIMFYMLCLMVEFQQVIWLSGWYMNL